MNTDSDYPFGIFKLFFDIDLRFANGWTEIAKMLTFHLLTIILVCLRLSPPSNNTGMLEAFTSWQ
jgi:hypothetical protein